MRAPATLWFCVPQRTKPKRSRFCGNVGESARAMFLPVCVCVCVPCPPAVIARGLEKCVRACVLACVRGGARVRMRAREDAGGPGWALSPSHLALAAPAAARVKCATDACRDPPTHTPTIPHPRKSTPTGQDRAGRQAPTPRLWPPPHRGRGLGGKRALLSLPVPFPSPAS